MLMLQAAKRDWCRVRTILRMELCVHSTRHIELICCKGTEYFAIMHSDVYEISLFLWMSDFYLVYLKSLVQLCLF